MDQTNQTDKIDQTDREGYAEPTLLSSDWDS